MSFGLGWVEEGHGLVPRMRDPGEDNVVGAEPVHLPDPCQAATRLVSTSGPPPAPYFCARAHPAP